MNDRQKESDQKVKEFFDKLKKLRFSEIDRVSLVGEYAEALGREIAWEKVRGGDTQVRSFLEELWAIKSKIGRKREDFKSILPAIKLIKSKAAYKAARKAGESRLIGEKLKELIFLGIDSIEDQKDFEAFFEFYEAMIGYFYYYRERQGEKSRNTKGN